MNRDITVGEVYVTFPLWARHALERFASGYYSVFLDPDHAKENLNEEQYKVFLFMIQKIYDNRTWDTLSFDTTKFNKRKRRTKSMKNQKCKTCKRKDCQFYNKFMNNNCVALSTVYEYDCDCKFYKKATGDKING